MNDFHGDNQPFLARLQKTGQRLGKGLKQLENTYHKLVDKHLCVGITGLAGSGKSTFITSLINQLLQFENASLPGFSPVLSGRLLWVKLHPPAPATGRVFPYTDYYEGLASPLPQWPESTVDVSGCLLELRLKRGAGSLNPLASDQYSFFLELRDYPGEWLLDLALANLSFSQWCALCHERFEDFRHLDMVEELRVLDPLARAEPHYLADISDRFMQFAQQTQAIAPALRLVMPGRLLIPQGFEAAKLPFIPLFVRPHNLQSLQESSADGYYKIAEASFERYKTQWVKPFVDQVFDGLDRQVVLVDVINALHQGPVYMDAMIEALANIAESFRYGQQHRLLQILQPKIDKVMFTATKIDQVLASEHEAVRQLLGVVVRQAYSVSVQQGASPQSEAVASVRASREEKHGNATGIVGLGHDGRPVGYIHPSMPSKWPTDEHWQAFTQWQLPRLNPPKGLSHINGDALPHIRMDTLINSLIGDKCL